MKKRRFTGIVSVIVALLWTSMLWCAEQPASEDTSSSTASSSDEGTGAMGGMKEKMDSGMHKMMSEKIDKMIKERMAEMRAESPHGKEKRAIGAYAIMGPFHEWIGCLMTERSILELRPDQKDQMDDLLTRHLMAAVRGRAEARALQMELKHALRKETVDLQAIEPLLRKITDQEFELLKEGIQLYKEVIGILTAGQREKMEEMIGSPFPPPWHGMAAGSCCEDFRDGSSKPYRERREKKEKMGQKAHH